MQGVQFVLDWMRKPRVTTTIPEDVYQFLAEWAERDQRPLSNLVSFVLTTAVRKMREEQEQKNGSPSLQQKTSPSPSKAGKGD